MPELQRFHQGKAVSSAARNCLLFLNRVVIPLILQQGVLQQFHVWPPRNESHEAVSMKPCVLDLYVLSDCTSSEDLSSMCQRFETVREDRTVILADAYVAQITYGICRSNQQLSLSRRCRCQQQMVRGDSNG